MEHDLPDLLPIMTIADYGSGKHTKMKDFIDNERNLLYRKLTKEVLIKPGKSSRVIQFY